MLFQHMKKESNPRERDLNSLGAFYFHWKRKEKKKKKEF